MHAKFCNTKTAATLIHEGGVIAYPTESVYGLGCDPANEAALLRLLAIKKRANDKGLILIASDRSQLDPYIESPNDSAIALMDKHWPGPVTLVVNARASTSPLLTGNRDTLAVRVSGHPVVRALCDACGHALVSTSANISGQEAIRDTQALHALLADDIDAIVIGELGTLDRPSMIIDARSGDILRH